MMNVFLRLAAALANPAADAKLALTAALAADWRAGRLNRGPLPANGPTTVPAPGWPASLRLVEPKAVPHRSVGTREGRAGLIHAMAHIEFSAINLALDHALRYPELPAEYCGDWIGVAAEEAMHFTLLRERLRTLDYDYGDFPAHASLWQMAEKTMDDVLARMALVPRLLEARGLDATPPMRAKFEKVGDGDTASVLDIILEDEVRHVAIGDRWFRHFCTERGMEPEVTYRRLIAEYAAPWPQIPMNETARRAAGFTPGELAALAMRSKWG